MVKILLYEDNASLAEGLTLLLDSVPDYKVEGCFKNLNGIESHIRKYKPHIVLMDIGFPADNGIDGLRKIKGVDRSIKVVMLTGMADDEHVFESIKAGADGYILKKTAPDKLIEYVREALDGGAPMTPTVARQVLATFSTPVTNGAGSEGLTQREKEVLKLLVNGLSYKLVAFELNISIDTVRSHIKNIYDKLEVNSKSEAVAKAIRNNIV